MIKLEKETKALLSNWHKQLDTYKKDWVGKEISQDVCSQIAKDLGVSYVTFFDQYGNNVFYTEHQEPMVITKYWSLFTKNRYLGYSITSDKVCLYIRVEKKTKESEKKPQVKKDIGKIETTLKRFTDGHYDVELKNFNNDKGELDCDALNKVMDAIDIQKNTKDKGKLSYDTLNKIADATEAFDGELDVDALNKIEDTIGGEFDYDAYVKYKKDKEEQEEKMNITIQILIFGFAVIVGILAFGFSLAG